MSTTTLKYSPALPLSFFPSFAFSDEASGVRNRVAGVYATFTDAESLNAQNVRDFHNTYLDAKEQNWDGYDAKPVSEVTFKRAKVFLEKCFGRFPAPSSGATPSGALSFEWYLGPTKRFIVSISDEDEIAYAGLFGSASVHGTEAFHGELPQALPQYLNRLYPA